MLARPRSATDGSRSDIATRSVVLRSVIRARLPLCLGAAIGSAWAFSYAPADLNAFAGWGSQLIHGHPDAVYASAQDQAGPLQLVMSWLLMAGSHTERPLRPVVAAVNALLVFVAMRACPTRGDAGTVHRRQLLVGVLAVLWVTQGGVWAGHTAEMAIPLLWMLGLHEVARGRGLRGALLLGLAGGVAPWAVLALPALLAVTRVRLAVLLAATAVMITVGLYLPFVLTGHFAMFQHVWPVSDNTVIAYVDPALRRFDWAMRLGQAVVVGAGTAGVALMLCHRPLTAITLVPLTTALLRLLTDPLSFDYYWISVGVLATAALILAPLTMRTFTAGWRLVALPYVSWLCVALEHNIAGAVLCLATVLSLAAPTYSLSVLGKWRVGRGSPQPTTVAT